VGHQPALPGRCPSGTDGYRDRELVLWNVTTELLLKAATVNAN
jgi:hypothetical protein